MNEEDCKFQKIELFHQMIDKKDISYMFYNMYNSICFSTFPYLLYKESNSAQSIRSYNSGNCIAFVYFMKMYLLKNHHVKSYIIGASVPDLFKVDGTPHMCHCALLVPISTSEFYVIDGALYFIEPMYCSLHDMKERQIYSCNAHRHEKTIIRYSLQPCKTCELDNNYSQIIPKDSLCIHAQYDALPEQQWNYYLIEIKNPDNNIGKSFLEYKPDPFIMYTVYEGGIVKMKYKLEIQNEELIIKEYPSGNIIYRGDTYDDNPNLFNIKRKLHRYLSDYMI